MMPQLAFVVCMYYCIAIHSMIPTEVVSKNIQECPREKKLCLKAVTYQQFESAKKKHFRKVLFILFL